MVKSASSSKKSKRDNPWFAFIRKIQKEQGIKKWGDAIKAAVKEKPRYFKERKSGESQKGGENDDTIGDSVTPVDEDDSEEQSGGKRRRRGRTAKKSRKSKKSKSRRTRRRR